MADAIEAARRAELVHAEKQIRELQRRFASPSLMDSEEPDTIASWRRELAQLERRATKLRG